MAASVSNLSISYPNISIATTTSATKNDEHLPNLGSKLVTKPQEIIFSTPNKMYTVKVTTGTTPTMTKTTITSRPALLSSHVTTAATKATTTMEAMSGRVNTTMSETSSKSTKMKTRAISWSNSDMQPTACINTSISKLRPQVSKAAEKTTPKASTFTHLSASDKGHESNTTADVFVPGESKPNGIERSMASVIDYTSIVLLGDQRGSTKIVQNAILTSLCSNNKYKDPSLIQIDIVTQYVHTESGSIATELTFQVRFMGNLLTSSEVHTALYTDRNTSLPNVLKSINLEQIEPNPHEQGQQQETENNRSWIEKNVVILAVTGGILLTICIGTGIYFVKRKRNDREKEWSMVVYDNQRKSLSLSTDPTVYLENPIYNVYNEDSSTSES
ncbi:hypothetical protein CHS0354_039201 [Potamilus streckersoni]|uniref:Uncharacterized protein n=1 Tax=Potamilus streckersoni TaxID=2493646 RepID=A0AAE0TD53_9BIVA|nr:hypothetical protein CHS0354_039201 [Potamilus streckersoni]